VEEGMESTDIIDKDKLFENNSLNDLLDIRDCLAYTDYLILSGKKEENLC
jgi:hypothetical protein